MSEQIDLKKELVFKHRQIDAHPFTTAESVELRKKINDILVNLREEIKKMGGQIEVTGFAYGSVGVGMAEADSDFDGTIIYESKRADADLVILRALRNLHLSLEYQHLKPHSFQNVLSDALNPSTIKCLIDPLEDRKVKEGAIIDLGSAAIIFAPSIDESLTNTLSEVVNSWRRLFIQKLEAEYPQESELIWSFIQAYIVATYVDYETQTMGQAEKRPKRVTQIFNKVIRDRFGVDREKQKRVLDKILDKRRNFHFLTLTEVKKALEIN